MSNIKARTSDEPKVNQVKSMTNAKTSFNYDGFRIKKFDSFDNLEFDI